MAKTRWKKGRGKLGVLAPLLGRWKAKAESPMGTIQCTRSFEQVLGGRYIQLSARWSWKNGGYEEVALFGAPDGDVSFWSFTSDGKRSQGVVSGARDVHPEAIAFEARMPAGLARMIYWPLDDGGIGWAVEAKSKKGRSEERV